jgi:hypothetical protein
VLHTEAIPEGDPVSCRRRDETGRPLAGQARICARQATSAATSRDHRRPDDAPCTFPPRGTQKRSGGGGDAQAGSGGKLVSGSTNPIVDSHWHEALLLIIAAVTLAGDTWGLGKWWGNRSVVTSHRWLR